MAGAQVGRIRRRATFQDLARPDGRGIAGSVRASYTRVTEGRARPCVAYAIGRPVGSAVQRNRLRRRMRAGVARLRPTLANGSYLVKADKEASRLGFSVLVEQLGSAMTDAADRAGVSTQRPER